jgi:hypothetical protein
MAFFRGGQQPTNNPGNYRQLPPDPFANQGQRRVAPPPVQPYDDYPPEKQRHSGGSYGQPAPPSYGAGRSGNVGRTGR